MRSVYRFGAAIAALAVISAVGLAQTPGRNSFLTVSARSTSELISQVRNNAHIRDSYERHFHMSGEDLYAYLRTLKPMRLREDTVFTVYSVPPGGELKAHTQRLRKGELIFVDDSGKPILRARCGNPLVGAPPGVVPEETIEAVPPEMRVMEVPSPELVPTVLVAMQPAPPVVPELVVEQPPVAVPVATATQSIPLWPLLALPLVGGSTSGGDNPVPEPATMIALGAGAAAVMARKRRKA